MSEWCPDNYPESYRQSFHQADNTVVKNYHTFLESRTGKIDALVVSIEERGTIVHTVIKKNDHISLLQINWADPQKTPGDYLQEGYANKFWQFEGPPERQATRAKLLAKALDIPVLIIDQPKELQSQINNLLLKKIPASEESVPSFEAPPAPVMYTPQTVASSFAAMALKDSYEKGKRIEIPSLGLSFFKSTP